MAIYTFVTERGIGEAVAGLFSIMLVLLFAFDALIYRLNIIKINAKGIAVRNAFVEIIDISWQEVKGVYIYQFTGTEKIRIPYKTTNRGVRRRRKYGNYNLGGAVVYVPRKIPKKWIFIDDGRGENGENIFEYLVPLEKGSIVKMKYKEKIFEAIKENYQKEIIEKTVEIREV